MGNLVGGAFRRDSKSVREGIRGALSSNYLPISVVSLQYFNKQYSCTYKYKPNFNPGNNIPFYILKIKT